MTMASSPRAPKMSLHPTPVCGDPGALKHLLILGAGRGCECPPVHTLMLEQMLLLAKAAAAGGTQVGPLAGVVALVPGKVGLLAEAAATLGAWVGPFACVNALMDGERRPP